MLKNNLILFKFFRFLQSGLYLDFLIKNFSETLIRNILTHSSIFFGEKYLVEVLTKKIIDSFIFNFSKNNYLQLNTNDYFFLFFTTFIYMLVLFIIIIYYL